MPDTELAKRLRSEAEKIRQGYDEVDEHAVRRLYLEAAEHVEKTDARIALLQGRLLHALHEIHRPAFEKWAAHAGDALEYVLNLECHGQLRRYLSDTTQSCWRAYTAGLSAGAPANARAAFERWTADGGNALCVFHLARCADVDRYVEPITELCWLAYTEGQAAAQSGRELRLMGR